MLLSGLQYLLWIIHSFLPHFGPQNVSRDLMFLCTVKRKLILSSTDVLVDRGLYGNGAIQLDGSRDSSKTFKLPKQPIIYAPSGMDKLIVEKSFDVSSKALFHVMFGDKSVVWQLLYHERRARRKYFSGPLCIFTLTTTKLIASQTSSKDRGFSWNMGTCVVNSNTRLII